MKCSDIHIALSTLRLRSGRPFELIDDEGRRTRIMHLDGDRFELRMRGGRIVEYDAEMMADMLFFLEGRLTLREIGMVEYEVNRELA
jgi:hypothetical protein